MNNYGLEDHEYIGDGVYVQHLEQQVRKLEGVLLRSHIENRNLEMKCEDYREKCANHQVRIAVLEEKLYYLKEGLDEY